jgi:hypothetical protein
MLVKNLLVLTILVAAILFSPAIVFGGIATSCDVEYNEDTNTVDAWAFVSIDYNTFYYYSVYVRLGLYTNGNEVPSPNWIVF